MTTENAPYVLAESVLPAEERNRSCPLLHTPTAVASDTHQEGRGDQLNSISQSNSVFQYTTDDSSNEFGGGSKSKTASNMLDIAFDFAGSSSSSNESPCDTNPASEDACPDGLTNSTYTSDTETPCDETPPTLPRDNGSGEDEVELRVLPSNGQDCSESAACVDSPTCLSPGTHSDVTLAFATVDQEPSHATTSGSNRQVSDNGGNTSLAGYMNSTTSSSSAGTQSATYPVGSSSGYMTESTSGYPAESAVGKPSSGYLCAPYVDSSISHYADSDCVRAQSSEYLSESELHSGRVGLSISPASSQGHSVLHESVGETRQLLTSGDQRTGLGSHFSLANPGFPGYIIMEDLNTSTTTI